MLPLFLPKTSRTFAAGKAISINGFFLKQYFCFLVYVIDNKKIMPSFSIIKKYHFHAAHRNETLTNKCCNIHGHTYHVQVSVQLEQDPESGVTTLFEDLDRQIEPVVKRLDHAMLLNRHDPLADDIRRIAGCTVDFDGPTSAENVARYLYDEICRRSGLKLDYLDLQETTTSVVRYRG